MNNSPRYYFTPVPTERKTNEYVNNFVGALSKEVNVVNLNKKVFARSYDFLINSFRSDIMILNWPEDILHLRLGIIQLFASFFVFTLFKIRGKKIIWVCHNKDSHTKKYKGLRILTRKFFTRIADKIIVHSEDALSYFPKQKNKIFFLNHPVYENAKSDFPKSLISSIDVLIWGKISAYKGLNEFITNYKNLGCSFNVLITGEADKSYVRILQDNAIGTRVVIKDEFISNEQLQKYFNECKIILLPYLSTDTFSSGALIHSINSNKVIIGPRVGNFIDLENEGACIAYGSVEEMLSIINKLLNDHVYYNDCLHSVTRGIATYYEKNSWHNFIIKLIKIINS